MKPLCIYHANCTDGFGAAWVVRRALGDEVEFHPGIYNEAPPFVGGRDVIMVDFSYSQAVLCTLASMAKSILILDHHKTAQQELVDLPPNVMAVFDMNHSGAMLAWRHYFPDEAPPQMIKFIEDRDLWRFSLEDTQAAVAAIASYPQDFDVWDRLAHLPTSQLRAEGVVLLRQTDQHLRDLMVNGTRLMMIGAQLVPAINLPHFFASDAGHIMSKGHFFVAVYWDEEDGRHFSLRSAAGGADVSEIARLYGGGGHEHAAGFVVDWPTARAMEDMAVGAEL